MTRPGWHARVPAVVTGDNFMLLRWEAECEFRNAFMHEHGSKRNVTVTAANKREAESQARLAASRALFGTTAWQTYMQVLRITEKGRA